MKPKPLKGRTWNPYTIPDVINPGGVRCVQVFIPDSLQWLQIFAAVMDTMCHWKNYELLGDTSAGECAALMRTIMRQYNTFETCQSCADGVEFDGDELMTSLCESLRWNNGVLQAYCCGAWTNIGGAGGGSGPGAVPGAVTQPPPTEGPEVNDCREFYVTLNARDKWLLPFPVSAGATIQVLDATGGWNDGTPTWACPTGAVYGLGICGAPLALTPGDPIPTLPHMQIVAQYGTVDGWFDPMAFPFVVPSGVTNEQVTFQANDSVLTDNQGSVTFKVQVCNQEALQTWTDTFNSNNASVETDFSTVAGRTYRIVCDGSVCHNPSSPGDVHDAVYTSNDDYATHTVQLFGAGPLFYGLILDNQNIPVLPFDAGHHYVFVTTGTGAPFVFKSVPNAPYTSCGGQFTVTVQELAD